MRGDVERIRRLRMKKALVLLAAGIFLLACLPVFSQAQSTSSQDVYVKTVHIIKLWMHPLGYKVQFFNSHSRVAEIYVPLTWFNKGTESKADLAYGLGSEYPYFSVYWVDNKFDHIMIYALDNYNDTSWGVLESAADLSSQFNTQEVPKEF
jgi:hypothetical protein